MRNLHPPRHLTMFRYQPIASLLRHIFFPQPFRLGIHIQVTKTSEHQGYSRGGCPSSLKMWVTLPQESRAHQKPRTYAGMNRHIRAQIHKLVVVNGCLSARRLQSLQNGSIPSQLLPLLHLPLRPLNHAQSSPNPHTRPTHHRRFFLLFCCMWILQPRLKTHLLA